MQDLTDATFQEAISGSKLPVLVDFWASWCGPCKMLAPVVDEIAQDLSGKLNVVKVNIEDNPMTPAKLGVRSIPTLLLFVKGEVVASEMGLQPKEKLLEWLKPHLL